MNGQHKAIRALLSTMAPKRAIEYVKSFELPEEEERYLIERDVRKKSYAMIACQFHTTPEVIKSRRRSAFSKIADAINNS